MRALLERLARRPLHRRVTLLVVALVSVSILVSNLAGYVALRVTLQRASQSVAMAMADDLAAPAASSIAGTGSLRPDLRQAGGTLVEATCTDGRVLRVPGSPGRLVLDPADLRAAPSDARPVLRTGVDEEGHRYTVAAVPAGTTGCALVVARPLTTLDSILGTQQLVVLNVVLAGLLVAGVASTFVARSGLHPVHQLSAAVQHVTETRDFQPVRIGYAQGDLATLTDSFNQLLRALAETRERQTRLVADAGHELRTPLTSLTTNVDLLRADLHRDVLTQAQRGRVLDDVGEQLAELSSMVRDLVQLSRDDTASAFRPLDLRDPVRAAAERVQRRAGGRVLDLQLEEFHVVGDADGLERAVTNLLDNAVKWSPPDSTIRVRLTGNRLVVADSGPGIPEADLPYVFDRFFRGATGRDTHGTGLGLSIVAKTVEDHGGTVRAGRSADGGAEFTVQLPGVTHVEAMPSILVPAS